MQNREAQLQVWIRGNGISFLHWMPLSPDASFRRYFRAYTDKCSLIAVDAPPNTENNHGFVAVATAFLKAGLQVPKIIAKDFDRGFLLLSDLGDVLYSEMLDENTADNLYHAAFLSLHRVQSCQEFSGYHIPPYDEALLMRELSLFSDWYLGRYLGLSLTPKEVTLLQRVFTDLTQSALAQPKVCVHRDYHSRNLMHLTDGQPGILDFQDAVYGPATYDLVSLVKDCYVAWPSARVEQWVGDFYEGLSHPIKKEFGSLESFSFCTNRMGMQRHLKAIGIFARLFLRDGKARYLDDIPRTLSYVIEAAKECDAPDFAEFLETRVLEQDLLRN